MRSTTIPPEPLSSHEAEKVLASLEQIRLRLLDLTSRNKLINFRHTNSTIRVIGLNLDRVHLSLVSVNQSIAVPLPSATNEEEIGELGEKPVPRPYAEKLGWDVSFDLSRGEGRVDLLPVLHYKDDFDIDPSARNNGGNCP